MNLLHAFVATAGTYPGLKLGVYLSRARSEIKNRKLGNPSTQFKRVVQTAVKVHKTGSFREIFRNRRMGIHRVGSCNRRTVQPPARV